MAMPNVDQYVRDCNQAIEKGKIEHTLISIQTVEDNRPVSIDSLGMPVPQMHSRLPYIGPVDGNGNPTSF